MPDHARLWSALGCQKDSAAAQFFQHHVPNYLSMSLDEIFDRGYQKFGKSHSCLAMNQRKKELLLTSSSFHDLLWKTSDPDTKIITMEAMFNQIKLILSCNHNVDVDASEAIQIFCRVMPEAMKDELKSKLNPSEVGDVYKLPLERFEQAIRLVRPVSKAEMRHMVKQQAHARRTMVASAPAETLEQHSTTESSDCDQDWSTDSTPPPLASAPAESAPTYAWTMLDTAPPRRTSGAPAKGNSRGSATQRTAATLADALLGPGSSPGGSTFLQVAAYDIGGEGATKDGKPPRELPAWLLAELSHPRMCPYCRRLGMAQTRVDRNGLCPFDPKKPMDPRKGHWRVWLCIYISGIEGTPGLLELGWTDAALEASKAWKPEDFEKYKRLLDNTTVLNTRIHNKAERADSATKTQPATGTQRANRLGEKQ